LENKQVFNRTWSDNNLVWIDFRLGILLVEFGNLSSELEESLDMKVIFLMGLFAKLLDHAFWWWEWGLSETHLVDVSTLSDQGLLELVHNENWGKWEFEDLWLDH